ncbi:MAG: sensor histidine kinase [Sarcina sp.]|nr:sensor histidine kinase [Sarcina sp.]
MERVWGSVRKSDKDKNQGVILSVTDDGIGIPAEDQSRIFERFYRADSSRSSRNDFGAGLGLSMVRKIMEIHGGTVSVESLPRQGSTFYLVFPAESCLHKQI